MSRLLLALSNVMIVSAVAGLLTLGIVLFHSNLAARNLDDSSDVAVRDDDPDPTVQLTALSATESPITHLKIPRIGVDTAVVPAKYEARDGGTWDIPAFKVGHAELTAGAGQRGNAVLLGHLTSISVGQVFHDLDQVKVGDDIAISGAADDYHYQVVDVSTVSRFDVSVLGPTPTASVSLITCTGTWMPLEHDYDRRLVVRAELRES